MATKTNSQSSASRSKLWLVLAGSVLLAAIVVGVPVYLYSHDESAPDDRDLLMVRPTVPETQNGVVIFTRMPKDALNFEIFADDEGVDEFTAGKIRVGEMKNDALVAKFLAKVQPTMQQIEVALTKPEFDFTREVSPDTTFPELSRLMEAGRVLLMATRQKLDQGDIPGALRDWTEIRLLGKRTGEGHGGIIIVLTGLALEGMAQTEAERWINDPACPPELLVGIGSALCDEVDWGKNMQEAFRLEYQYFTKCVYMAKHQPSIFSQIYGDPKKQSGNFIFTTLRTGKTLALAQQIYRSAMRATAMNYLEGKAVLSPLATDGDKGSLWNLLLPNGGGWYLMQIVVVRPGNILATMHTRVANGRMLQAGLALRRYFDEHGRLPDKMADLVPHYISGVPLDPFDGQALRYDATRGLVYSVGKLLKDVGGSKFVNKTIYNPEGTDPFFDSDQPTFALEFQKTPAPKVAAALPAN